MEIVVVLAVVGAVAVTFTLTWLLVPDEQGLRQRRLGVWEALANERGGSFDPRSEGIYCVAGQAIVFVDTHTVSRGQSSSVTYTRARATYPIGHGPRFRVHRQGFFQALGEAFGAQDVALGNLSFDKAFRVKSDNPAGLRRAFTGRAMRLIMYQRTPVTVRCDGQTVSVETIGALDDPAEVGTLIDIAGELASIGARELAKVGAEAGGIVRPPKGGWSTPRAPLVEMPTRRGAALAEVEMVEHRLPVTLGRSHRRELTPFTVVLPGESQPIRELDIPSGMLNERAIALLPRLGQCTLCAEAADISLAWRDMPKADQLRTGAEFLAEFASSGRSVGAFR